MRKLAVVLVSALVASSVALAPVSARSFDDVAGDAFYADAVEWLASTGITTGTGERTFSPGDFVTRGQMAAFLARFGSSVGDAEASGFVDVPADAFFAAPVDWLVERGITTGTSSSTYSPGDFVTRGQMAAFLWRFVGRTPSDVSLPFDDVPAGTFYAEAVRWLVDAGITTGTSATTYSPDAFVTRGQMAAFLHRLAGEPGVGDVGLNRTAAMPVPAAGGAVDEGGVSIVIGALTDAGYVRVLVGQDGSTVALTGAVSDGVEIIVTDADFDGPITVTVPIDTVDLDAVDLIVNVLDANGVWQSLAVTVTTEVVDGQMVATFTLPAGVILAPAMAGLDVLAAGDRSRIVTRVAAQAVASPTTTTSSPPPTSPPPVDHELVLNASALDVVFVVNAIVDVEIGAEGGSGTYVDYRASGLPPGLELVASGNVGVLSGTPTSPGTSFVTLTVEDSEGLVASTVASIVVAAASEEADVEVIENSGRFPAYPSVTPDGRYMSHGGARQGVGAGGDLVVTDLRTGETVSETVSSFIADSVDPAPVSDDGAWLAFVNDGELTVRDTVADTEVVVAAGALGRPFMSPDGRFIAFSSTQDDLTGDVDTNGASDVFIWDRVANQMTRATNGSSLAGSRVIDASRNLRYLVIRSASDLGGADPATEGVYLFDRVFDSLFWVGSGPDATISADGSTVYTSDGASIVMTTEGFPRTVLTSNGSATGRGLQTSTDGRFLAFASNATTFSPDDTAKVDVFVWDRDQGDVVNVTNDALSIPVLGSWSLTDDGSLVSFQSASEALTEDDDNNGTGLDLFLWHRPTGSYERVTNGESGLFPGYSGLSGDGTLVWFLRATPELRVHTWQRAVVTPGVAPASLCPAPGGFAVRGHMALNIWRAVGSPAPTHRGSTWFVDVPAGSAYDDAAGWLVENGVTVGTSPTTFDPDLGLTRAQYVVLLSRVNGDPDPVGSGAWSDVPDGTFFSDAAQWAFEQGLAGTSPSTFGPNEPMGHDDAAQWHTALGDGNADYFDCTPYSG